MKRRAAWACALAAWLLLGVTGHGYAHGSRTALLEVQQLDDGAFSVVWKPPLEAPSVGPLLPAGCVAVQAGDAVVAARVQQHRCAGPLAGRSLGVQGLGLLINEAVVRVEFGDGTTDSAIVTPDNPTWTPRAQGAATIAASYLRHGMGHILAGPDHLLFLLALAFLARGCWRTLLVYSTTFTVAHSLTLAGGSLGLLNLSAAAAEANIGLSLVYAAHQLLSRGARPGAGRGDVAAVFFFGLVHGLGFASGLVQTGLPAGDVVWKLLSFNMGVELGQCAVLAALLGVARLGRGRVSAAVANHWAAMLIGALGTYWVLQRVWQP